MKLVKCLTNSTKIRIFAPEKVTSCPHTHGISSVYATNIKEE